jgi:SAM-dependent methyltransferase
VAKLPLAVQAYQLARTPALWMRFLADYRAFKRLAGNEARPQRRLRWSQRLPMLFDRTASTGFDRHYVYHVSWAMRVLARTRPAHHIDVSSSLYFCGAASAFVPVTFYDYRPADLRLSGLESRAGDLMALPQPTASVESLSCMHVIEHIGLGRYGDPLDPDGDLKAIAELKRVLAPGGNLMFVTPTGRPTVRFNAHRIYGYRQILDYFSPLTLKEFALVPDDPAEGFIIDATEQQADRQEYGCGCYWFVNPVSS